MECDVLICPDMAARGKRMLQAMVATAPEVGVQCHVTSVYRPRHRLLMSYGLGHPVRRHWTRQHVRAGGQLIGWDLSYWGRNQDYMRLALNGEHARVCEVPGDRFSQWGIELRDDYDPAGPVVLCGMGRKSRISLDFNGQEWEHRTLRAIRAAYPGRRVLYRPKRDEALDGCATLGGAIEDAIRGASLVVCRHSNVAVDACIAGVPVVCEDGAAVALYGADLASPAKPSPEQRLRFLQQLAWWQWSPGEAKQAWRFLWPMLSG